jgi:hypothetical protein
MASLTVATLVFSWSFLLISLATHPPKNRAEEDLMFDQSSQDQEEMVSIATIDPQAETELTDPLEDDDFTDTPYE